MRFRLFPFLKAGAAMGIALGVGVPVAVRTSLAADRVMVAAGLKLRARAGNVLRKAAAHVRELHDELHEGA